MSSWQIYSHMPASPASLLRPGLLPTLWAFFNLSLPGHQRAHSVQTGAESGPHPILSASSGPGTQQMLVNEGLAE